MIFFDTSLLIDALTGSRRSLPDLMRVLERGERLALCSIVAYEWLRGPRNEEELRTQDALFPSEAAIPFDSVDAALAAKLYRSVRRARSREADLAIAACAIRHNAEFWTLNPTDFRDVPGLRLFAAR